MVWSVEAAREIIIAKEQFFLFPFLKADVFILCSRNGLLGSRITYPTPFIILDCHVVLPHRAPNSGPRPHTGSLYPRNFGCQPGPRAPGSEEISDSVHFGLALAPSHHLQHSSLGTQQRKVPGTGLMYLCIMSLPWVAGCPWYVEKTFLQAQWERGNFHTQNITSWSYSVLATESYPTIPLSIPWLLD